MTSDQEFSERPEETNDTREEQLAALFADCSDRLNAGDTLDFDEIIAEHPELEPELSEALEALRDLDPALELDGLLDTLRGYRLIRELGRGGMGIVYLAEQIEPIRRQVAVKVIKLGMDTEEVVARFESERQALALMNHPHIARVFDAGATKSGRPYFVMEYVPGEPITQYCDRHRLDTRGRLGLFMQVCHAIQHAHQKAVIHRDLKPSNILVTDEGEKPIVKIIDFGVARATNQRLTERTVFTEKGQLIGTPEYMSPEQAEMTALDIDTRTDIYSLGMVLYEMLVGVLPFDESQLRQAGYLEIQRLIREEEPPKPSSRLSGLGEDAKVVAKRRQTDLRHLARQLRGDLDWITMKALEKDRVRRYANASELAADIDRYLSHEAVFATPPSVTYRLKKSLRKHQGFVAAASAILAVLCAGLVASLAMYFKAQTEAEARARALNRSEALRFTTQSSAVLARDPGLALLLAMEAAKRRQSRITSQALFDALGALRERKTLVGHAGAVDSAVFSRDSRRVLTASKDGTARIWDAESGEEIVRLEGHTNRVFSAVFSPDGLRVATASGDGTARIWDTASGAPILVLSGHQGQVVSANFSPDGERLVTASWDATARVWDARTGAQLSVLRGKPERFVEPPRAMAIIWAAFGPDGESIVTTVAGGTARLWDAGTGKELRALTSSNYAAFSPDGERVLAGFRIHGSRTVELERKKSILFSMAGGPIESAMTEVGRAAFRPDGKQVALRVSRHISPRRFRPDIACVWDAETGDHVLTLEGHDGLIRSVRYSLDGERLVTASEDRTARVWDARTGEELYVLRGHRSDVTSAAFSPDGRQIVTTSDDNTARIWREVFTLRGHEGLILSVVISADGKRIATSSTDTTARIWDARTGEHLLTLAGHSASVTSVVFSPDGQQIATASDDSMARLWDGKTGKQRFLLRDHTNHVASVAFSPDGRRLLTTSMTCAIIWDTETGERLVKFSNHSRPWIFCGSFSPDGRRVVTAGQDLTARIWDPATGREILSLPQDGILESATFTPDGKRVVTRPRYGARAHPKIWDSETGKDLLTLKGHKDWVFSSAVSPDGKKVATASRDKTARIWDAESGKELAVLRGHLDSVSRVAFGPEGKRVLTSSQDGTGRIWDAETGEKLLELGGLHPWHFSRDGRWVVASAGKEQNILRVLPVLDLLAAATRWSPRQLTAEEREEYALGSADEPSLRSSNTEESHRVSKP